MYQNTQGCKNDGIQHVHYIGVTTQRGVFEFAYPLKTGLLCPLLTIMKGEDCLLKKVTDNIIKCFITFIK